MVLVARRLLARRLSDLSYLLLALRGDFGEDSFEAFHDEFGSGTLVWHCGGCDGLALVLVCLEKDFRCVDGCGSCCGEWYLGLWMGIGIFIKKGVNITQKGTYNTKGNMKHRGLCLTQRSTHDIKKVYETQTNT